MAWKVDTNQGTYGPFRDRGRAEACVLAASKKEDVTRAELKWTQDDLEQADGRELLTEDGADDSRQGTA